MLKVLMVDDEPDLDFLIQQKFRKEIRRGDYQFLFARNGEGALKAFEDHSDINLVFSDLNMPQMNGIELLMKLQNSHPDVSVIIISAYSDYENMKLAKKAGAHSFITKPINLKELHDIVEKFHIHSE